MKLIEKILLFSTTKPIIVILLVIGISILLVPGLSFIKLDNDTAGYLDNTDDTYITMNYVDSLFESDGDSLHLSIESDNIYTYETIEYVYTVHKALEEMPYVDGVTSIINIEDVTGINNELKFYSLIPTEDDKRILPKTQEELDLLRKRVESNDKFKAYIVSNVTNDKGLPIAFNLMIGLQGVDDYNEVIENIEKRLEDLKDKRFKTHIFGEVYTYKEMNNQSRNDGILQGILAIIVIFFTYFLNFRSIRGIIFPQITNIISTLWIFSIMGYFGVKLSMMGMLILPLLIAVASSYGIHSLNQYYKESQYYTQDHKPQQIAISMRHILKTIVLAGVTTMIGISSLSVNRIIHLRTFGIFASIGVMFAIILSLAFIPALLSLLSIPKKKRAISFNKDFMDKIVQKIILFNIKHRVLVFIMFILVWAISIIGMIGIPDLFKGVTTDSSMITMFVKNHPVRKLTDYFSDNFDGTSTMDVVLDADAVYSESIKNVITKIKKNPELLKKYTEKIEIIRETKTDSGFDSPFDDDNAFSSPFDDEEQPTNESEIPTEIKGKISHRDTALSSDFLKRVEKLMEYATNNIDGVGRCYSFVDIIKRFHYVMNNDDKNYEVIPDSDDTIIAYMLLFEGDDDAFDKLIDRKHNFLKITMNLKNVGKRFIHTGDFRRIRTELSNYIENNFDTKSVNYFISGSSILYTGIQDHIVTGQILSIVLSLIIILIVNTILFKSLKTGIVSMIPLSTAIIINFGIMGFSGIVLDSATSLISALAIGIGVDDTIHFMLNIKKEIHNDTEKKLSIEALIYKTLRYTGKAIIYTSVALIFGFMVVVFSSFMPIKNFSILVSLTMVNATIATLFGLPSVILMFPSIVNVKRKEGKVFKVDETIDNDLYQ